jgi:hypothetical protein
VGLGAALIVVPITDAATIPFGVDRVDKRAQWRYHGGALVMTHVFAIGHAGAELAVFPIGKSNQAGFEEQTNRRHPIAGRRQFACLLFQLILRLLKVA